MRIAMIGHKRMPSREGGVEIAVEELAVRIAAKGHRVTCFNRRGKHVSGKQFGAAPVRHYRGVNIRHMPAIDVKGLAAITASVCASVCAAFGPYDVVHFHTEGPCATLWLPKLTGKRCVVTIHGLDHQRSKWGRLARKYILLGEKCAAAMADEIIVLSEAAEDYFHDAYGRRTVRIPNGTPKVTRQNACLIREKFGLGEETYFLYLGRITPEKGLDRLIDAYKRTATDKKLVIAGGASDSRDYFRALKEKAADCPDIIFTDFVQGEMLQELYSNAYAYVLPSDIEGMPLSLLEALSFGCCCLVSDIPENVSVAGGCGFTFRAGDTDDLAAQLRRISDDENAVQQCRQAAARRIKEMADWDEVVDRTLRLYERER